MDEGFKARLEIGMGQEGCEWWCWFWRPWPPFVDEGGMKCACCRALQVVAGLPVVADHGLDRHRLDTFAHPPFPEAHGASRHPSGVAQKARHLCKIQIPDEGKLYGKPDQS